MNSSLLLDHPTAQITSPTDGADHESWSVVFLLDCSLSEAQQGVVLSAIPLSAAFVEKADGTLMLSVGSVGAMDEALANAVSTVREVLEACVEAGCITEVRMVAHRNLERELAGDKPITYYGVTECARALGVSRQRVNQLQSEAKLPPPDALAGDKSLWRSDTFDKFAEERRSLIDRTPKGRDPRCLGFNDPSRP